MRVAFYINVKNQKTKRRLTRMTSKTNKRSALTSSIISLVLCMSMLLGTTVAWFTDSVTNTGNRIEAGTLKVKLLGYNEIEGKYVDISKGAGDIFATANQEGTTQWPLNGVLWEPGKTQVVYLGVQNAGDLAMNYNIILDVKNDAGNKVALEDVLTYAIVPGAQWEEGKNHPYAGHDWASVEEDARESGGNNTGAVPAGQVTAASNGALTAGNTDYFALAVHMAEEASNDFQNQAIEIDVQVVAKQMASESDSLNNQYDAGALFTEREEVVFVNRTFDETEGNAYDNIESYVGHSTSAKVESDWTGNNKCISVKRNGGGDCLIQLPRPEAGVYIPKDGVSTKMVVEFDIASATPGNLFMCLFDHNGGYFSLGSLSAEGKLTISSTELATLSADQWVSLAYLFDFDAKKVDIYVDGKLTVDDLSVTSIQSISRMRVQINGSGPNDIMLDNIKIYEGSAIRDISSK